MRPVRMLLAGVLAGLLAGTLPALAPADTAPVTPISDLRPDDDVTVSGTVIRITDEDEFLLRDATGEVPVYLSSDGMPVAPEQTITVMGRVDDDGPIEIYAREITLPGGDVVRFAPDR